MIVEGAELAVSGTAWFKSSYSSGGGGECVEVAVVSGAVYVRDSTDVDGPVLTIAPEAWARFVRLAAEQPV